MVEDALLSQPELIPPAAPPFSCTQSVQVSNITSLPESYYTFVFPDGSTEMTVDYVSFGGILSLMGTGSSLLSVTDTITNPSTLGGSCDGCSLQGTGMQLATSNLYLGQGSLNMIGSRLTITGSMPLVLSPARQSLQADLSSMLLLGTGLECCCCTHPSTHPPSHPLTHRCSDSCSCAHRCEHGRTKYSHTQTHT